MQDEVVRLRAMPVTDIVDATFSLYRRNFVLFAGVVAVLALPETAINVLVRALTPQPAARGTFTNFTDAVNAFGPVAAGSGVSSVLSFLFGTFITAALAKAISQRILGRQIGIVEAYTSIGPGPFLRLLAAVIVTGIGAFVALGVGVALIALAAIAINVASSGLAILFAVVAGIAEAVVAVWVALHFVFLPQTIVLEGDRLYRAYRRSWYLVSGYWWRVLGLYLLVSVLVAVISGLIGAFATALSLGQPLIGTALGGALGILVQPIQLSALTLLYYDQRIRKEGFDLEHAVKTEGWQPA